jgi:hypothetical protein
MADLTGMLQAAAGAVGGEYEIERSLRFNSADSAYLSRTPASAGNRKTWTYSVWVKKTRIIGSGNRMGLLGVGAQSSGNFVFGFANNVSGPTGDEILVDRNAFAGPASTAVYRDVSGWYHIVIAVDTTLASNRIKVYVNGSQLTIANLDNVYGQNVDTGVNSTSEHRIGQFYQNAEYFDGYLADAYLIDGQALTPSSFGEINADTGVWSPIKYTGTYGTNGFYLNFSDNSDTTASTLGKDYSGNGNNWTPNNFSVTAGAGNDSLVDSPTRYGTDTGAGGEVRGNYATLNPLAVAGASAITISNGNLDLSIGTSGAWRTAVSTFSISSGKWYWEVKINTASDVGDVMIGIAAITAIPTTSYSGSNATSYGYSGGGSKFNNGSSTAYGASMSAGDTIGVSLDMSTGDLVFYRNGSSQGTAFTVSTTTSYVAAVSGASTTPTYSLNFGQRPFAYTAPSGFKALVTTNLPDPTIVEGDDYFNTVLYTGNGSTQSITGVGFQPDWVWIKERNAAADHGLYDAVRGVQNQLESNNNPGETVESTGLTAFGSDGFTVGSLAQLNTNNDTYVAWNWNAGGSNATNTNGTITSTVRASTTAGISVLTFTGNNVAGATIGHGLGVVPAMIITKTRAGNDSWQVYHRSLPSAAYRLQLNLNNAADIANTVWNSTAPTSTVFSIGNNAATAPQVAYCFAEIPGYSAFNSYTGNGSADGPFVYTGFRPAWLMVKRSDSTSNWTILDFTRLGYNVDNNPLFPNLSDAETTTDLADLLSNGFKLRSTDASVNASTATYIYAAFATSPFKLSLAR